MKYTLEELKDKKKEIIRFDCENPDECLKAVFDYSYNLQYVKQQTPEICLAAVKRNGYALQFVKEQTEEICLEAVKQNGLALQFVKDLSMLEGLDI